ncbi:glycoprotein [Roseibium sp. TrichSKD4]|nr:glycoprotein [Roseibium sp. TrichSKD4]
MSGILYFIFGSRLELQAFLRFCSRLSQAEDYVVFRFAKWVDLPVTGSTI